MTEPNHWMGPSTPCATCGKDIRFGDRYSNTDEPALVHETCADAPDVCVVCEQPCSTYKDGYSFLHHGKRCTLGDDCVHPGRCEEQYEQDAQDAWCERHAALHF